MPRRNRPRRGARSDRRDRQPPSAPPSESQRLACKRKQRFATEREADDAVYRARMEGEQLAWYRCGWCDGWHLTSRRG